MSDLALTVRAGSPVTSESASARRTLIAGTVGILSLFLLAPLVVVAVEAGGKG